MLSLGVPLRASSSLRTSGNTFSSSSLTTSREGQTTIILIAGATRRSALAWRGVDDVIAPVSSGHCRHMINK